MNDTIGNSLALNDTFLSGEGHPVKACISSSVNCELGRHIFPGVLFGVEFSRGLSLKALERDEIAGLAALWGNEELGLVAVWGLGAEDHTVAHIVCEFSRLEVDQNHAKFVLHVLYGDQLLEA